MKKIRNLLAAVLALILLCSAFALPTYAASAIPQVKNLKVTQTDDDEIEVKWSKVSSVTGYRVYVKNGSGSWKLAATTKKTNCEIENLKSAEEYSIRVRAYKTDSKGVKTYGSYSATVVTSTCPDKVENVSIKNISETKATLSWKATSGADGYRIYKYNSSTGAYEKLTDVKKVTSVTVDVSKNGGSKFKVRAYNSVGGKKYWGEKSSSVTSGVKTIGYSKAESIALKDCGADKSKVHEYEAELKHKNGVYYYEVEFEYGKYEYEYKINAETGKIIFREKELR